MNPDNPSDIGFDPLAWMEEEPENDSPTPAERDKAIDAEIVATTEEPITTSYVEEHHEENESTAPAQVGTTEDNRSETKVSASADAEGTPMENSAGPFNLGTRLDVTRVSELKGELGEMLGQGAPLRLLADDIEHVDGAGLQLMVAVIRRAEDLQLETQWQRPSAALCEAAEISGLTQVLQLPG